MSIYFDFSIYKASSNKKRRQDVKYVCKSVESVNSGDNSVNYNYNTK